MIRFYKVPALVRLAYPNVIWKINTLKKELFLTFDDGPDPSSTLKILNILNKYQAKATWFCLGENLQNYRSLATEIVSEGHSLGNHTFDHISGWGTSKEKYMESVSKCQKELNKIKVDEKLFRPPYGRVKHSQLASLSDFKTYFWSRTSYDYERNLNVGQSIYNMTMATPGDIILLHDKAATIRNTQELLEAILEHFTNQGYHFNKLPK